MLRNSCTDPYLLFASCLVGGRRTDLSGSSRAARVPSSAAWWSVSPRPQPRRARQARMVEARARLATTPSRASRARMPASASGAGWHHSCQQCSSHVSFSVWIRDGKIHFKPIIQQMTCNLILFDSYHLCSIVCCVDCGEVEATLDPRQQQLPLQHHRHPQQGLIQTCPYQFL